MAQQRVDIRTFGAVGGGGDDTSVLKRALSSMHGGVLSIPAGLTLNASGSFDVPSGTSIDGGAKLVGIKLNIGSGTKITGLHFEGAASGIVVSSYAAQSNDVVMGNTFRGTKTAIYIAAAKSGATSHDLTISRNACESCGTFLFADKVDHSTFSGSVAQVQDRGLLFFGGSDNTIVNNQIDGGVTGISFVYQFAVAGENGLVKHNLIQDNQLRNVREESISFDIRGNEPEHAAVREVDKVASKSGATVTLSSPNWGAVGAALHQLYLCWMSGSMDGICLRSTGGSGEVFRLDADAKQMQQIQPGDQVIVGAPFLSNAVYRNQIQIDPANKHASGILFWGLSYNNVVCGNTITSPTPNTSISAIGIMSLNGLDQRSGVTVTPGGRKAPSDNNLVANNQVSNLRLEIGYQDWGKQVHFLSSGNLLVNNKVTGGGTIEIKDQKARPNSETTAMQVGQRVDLAEVPPAARMTLTDTGGGAMCAIAQK